MPKEVVVAKASEIGEGKSLCVKQGDLVLAVFKVDGSYYAIEDTCSHVGAPLSEGAMDGEVVICPWHGAKFNVRTGEVLAPPAASNVQAFPVRVEGDDLLISLSEAD